MTIPNTWLNSAIIIIHTGGSIKQYFHLQVVIDKMTKKMHKTLANTKFANCAITAVAANPGGNEEVGSDPQGIEGLIEVFD